jgi:hypothetical protein
VNAKERAVIECARAWRKAQDESGRGVSDWPGYPLIDAVDALDEQKVVPVAACDTSREAYDAWLESVNWYAKGRSGPTFVPEYEQWVKGLSGTAEQSAEPDPVERPPHYTSHPSGVECITIAEHFGFCVGNAVKYLWRAGLKGDELEDLRKARWYIDREIARREGAK